jgi:glycine cleavage system H protein
MNNIPTGLKYTDTHEWLKDEGNGLYRVGITEHAQSLLGDMVFIDLPESQKNYEMNENCATAESVKAASDIYAPISGEVTEVNARLVDMPELINHSPYEDGWIFVIKSSDPSQLNELYSPQEYQALIAE